MNFLSPLCVPLDGSSFGVYFSNGITNDYTFKRIATFNGFVSCYTRASSVMIIKSGA